MDVIKLLPCFVSSSQVHAVQHCGMPGQPSHSSSIESVGTESAAMYLVPLLLKSLALLTSSAEGVIHLLGDLKLTIGPLQCLPGQLGLLSACIIAQQMEAGKNRWSRQTCTWSALSK